MQFRSTRGRPKSDRPAKDLGTPELIFKRAHGLTEEPLDSCHRRGLITDAQHRSGMHFRWLHSIRFGTSDPRVTRWAQFLDESQISAEDDPNWRSARELEWQDAERLLRNAALLAPVMNLCVYNQAPPFLSRELCQRAFEQNDLRLAEQLEHTLEAVKDGLTLLTKQWKHS